MLLFAAEQARADDPPANPAPATAAPVTAPDPSKAWVERLEAIGQLLLRDEVLSPESGEFLRSIVDSTAREARAALARDEVLIGPLRKELQTLGPAPESGAESPQIATLRKRQQDLVSSVERRIQEARLVVVRTENLKTMLSRREAAEFERIFERSPSVFERKTWQKAKETLDLLSGRFTDGAVQWWNSAEDDWRTVRIVAAVLAGLLAAILAVPVRRLLRRWTAAQKAVQDSPEDAQRMSHAAAVAMAGVVVPWAGLGVLAVGLALVAPGYLFFENFLVNVCIAGILCFTILGFARAVVSPDDLAWPVLPVTEVGAATLFPRLRTIALFVGVFSLFYTTVRFGDVSTPEFLTTARLFTNTAFAALLLLLLPGRFWEPSKKPALRLASAFGRSAIALGLLAVPVLDLLGYSTLAAFFLGRLVGTVLSVTAAVLLRAVLQDVLAQTLQAEGRLHKHVERWLPLSEGAARLAQFWFGLLFDIVVYGTLVYLLAVFHGVPASFLNLWLERLLDDIQIGNVNLSLVDIALAVVVFFVGLVVTGWVRRGLAQRLLTNTRMDIGVRESIVSGVGYLGIVIVVLLAIAMIGLDLSKLALIASALSVGIGFGLRTVVENFVAGLLLLIERPIKSGDWIVVGNQEGTVKRISVRSTEIETFDRASVIVPNSLLISQAVQNWTHKTKLVRLTVPVGVAYGSEIEKVRDVLLACAEANENVLSYPEPQALFRSFGDSSLMFELRGFIPDANRRITTVSELHFAIDAAFRETGIEIAFPQLDLHVRDANLGEGADVVDTNIKLSAP